MTVWQILFAGTPVLFKCAPCAIDFYNQDRAARSAPNPVPTPDHAVFQPCLPKCVELNP